MQAVSRSSGKSSQKAVQCIKSNKSEVPNRDFSPAIFWAQGSHSEVGGGMLQAERLSEAQNS